MKYSNILLVSFVIVYLDDILVFSKTEEENLRHLNLRAHYAQDARLSTRKVTHFYG
jgi:hypothetical protein